MACWWAARRSIPRAGPSLCRPAWHRYYLPPMYAFLVGILILASLVLATAVLLPAGEGGPLPCRPTSRQAVFPATLPGHQEVFTGPSYLGQMVVVTAPMIGNYGINPEDVESDRPRVGGVVVRELSLKPSNWRSTGALADWLAEARVPIVAGVDTRQLTPHIPSKGAMRGAVSPSGQPCDAVRAP